MKQICAYPMQFAVIAITIFGLNAGAAAAGRLIGELPRQSERPLEALGNIDSLYGDFRTSDGYRLRTILTRPHGVDGDVPAVYFVQWLSCDSIEIGQGDDGWTQMLRGLVAGGGYAVMRTDKAGVGDSEGPACAELDYETELRHHREAFAHLLKLDGIDSQRVAVFGASMGSTMAPLVARGHRVAAVAAWGGGAKTWFERLVAFDRHALELGATDPAQWSDVMSRRARFHAAYLLEGLTPAQITERDPETGKAWGQIIGTGGDQHYGRPVAFHQQAQRQDWPAAWAELSAPVLVLYGEYDWFETESGHRTIVRAVNANSPNQARLAVIPQMDHHFGIYPSAEAAFRGEGGTDDAAPVLELLVPFLKSSLGVDE